MAKWCTSGSTNTQKKGRGGISGSFAGKSSKFIETLVHKHCVGLLQMACGSNRQPAVQKRSTAIINKRPNLVEVVLIRTRVSQDWKVGMKCDIIHITSSRIRNDQWFTPNDIDTEVGMKNTARYPHFCVLMMYDGYLLSFGRKGDQ